MSRKNQSIAQEELEISEYENLLDELSLPGTRSLTISGGEPLLKKGVLRIMSSSSVLR